MITRVRFGSETAFWGKMRRELSGDEFEMNLLPAAVLRAKERSTGRVIMTLLAPRDVVEMDDDADTESAPRGAGKRARSPKQDE
jgi:hypothetical protein